MFDITPGAVYKDPPSTLWVLKTEQGRWEWLLSDRAIRDSAKTLSGR